MGKDAVDLRPEKGATMLACTGAVRLMEATVAAEDTMDEAMLLCISSLGTLNSISQCSAIR